MFEIRDYGKHLKNGRFFRFAGPTPAQGQALYDIARQRFVVGRRRPEDGDWVRVVFVHGPHPRGDYLWPAEDA